MLTFAQQLHSATEDIRKKESRSIDIAIILGSGLSGITINLDKTSEFAYQDLFGLASPSVMSHKGTLRIGEMNKQCVAICQGRYHLYEGYSAQQVSMMVYLLAQLGAKKIIITNAAGALNTTFRPGDIMLIQDHINFTGHNPLVGQGDDIANRFVDMSKAYCPDLISNAQSLSKKLDLQCHTGIYAGVLGPSLETSAERRMLAMLGGDAVGMSTIMEVIAANHCNMRVLGISAITNMALGDEQQQVDTLEDVLHYAAIAGQKIKEIIEYVLSED